jgi:DNA-binding CsgD family transcriptional regulator
MKRPRWLAKTKERRATVLAGIILLQAICALFFVGDVLADITAVAQIADVHLGLEALAAVSLIAGILFLMNELRRLLIRMGDMDTGLRAAQGQMADVMQDFFDVWNLTEAERDVAIMILKGLDNETIAQVRHTAPGTVRAQATRVYAKSGSDGRAQFISLFMEELMSDDFAHNDAINPNRHAG